jgi:23S rRNA (guanosine2251-2'-O)-methyltransferase
MRNERSSDRKEVTERRPPRERKEDSQRRPPRTENRLPERNAEESENIIEGRNSVMEALKAERTVEKIYVAKGDLEGSIKKVIGMAKDKGIVVSEVDRKRLDEMSVSGNHQGVVAQVSPYNYFSLEEILNYAKSKGEDPFVIILDEIEDPHNLGSIVRTANASGAHGIIIPKRRSALVTQTVSKASAGAVEHTKIAKVTNLNQTIKELKDRGLWIIGTDMDGEVLYQGNLTGPVGLVIGSEGKGISRLVRENCDLVVSIPMKGQINSLNASVAAGVIMYEVVRQRSMKK